MFLEINLTDAVSVRCAPEALPGPFVVLDLATMPNGHYLWLHVCGYLGEIVVPFVSGRSTTTPGTRAAIGEPRPPVLVAFRRNSPQERVEAVLRDVIGPDYLLTADEVERMVRTYHALAGLP